MQSHEDFMGAKAWDDLQKLKERAEELSARGENLITAGAPGEPVLFERMRGGFLLRKLPNDALALRISIGEAHDKRISEASYLGFRGAAEAITTLLRRARAALAGAET